MNKYVCRLCNYSTNRKFNMEKHEASKKHINKLRENSRHTCQYCNKTYKYYKSFVTHRCKSNENGELKALLHQVIKENKKIKEELSTAKGVTNYNFNIHIFLQNECREAVNWFDFIKSLKIGENEIKDVLNSSLTSSMINVLVDGINKLGLHRRPVHCLDLKRKKLCIRENNEWIKDENDTLIKINKGEELLQDKYIKAVNIWEEEYPIHEENNNYVELCKKVTNVVDDKKIVRMISKETHI